ncbi:MAG TPA: HNH endonuclease signature motif containing protein, partial [Thermodesulfobacteriota bacterium]
LEHLADGSVTLTTVTLLAPHLTAENHLALLDQARHRSRREVEALVAALRPLPPVPPSIRRLPVPRTAPAARPSLAEAARASALGPAPVLSAAAPPPAEAPPVSPPAPYPEPSASPPAPAVAPPPPARPPVVAPLAPERYRVQFTASTETYTKLRQAQDLLRHQIPDGDVAQVLDRALTVLVETLLKQKVGATGRPRAGTPPRPGSRHVPAAVRRAVWARDGGRCAFVSRRTGRRCAERGFLEFHHVRPYAAGGAATVENIELCCRAHNGYEAERMFGPWGASQVREAAVVYATACRAPGPVRTRFEPSWASAGRPP